MADKDKDGTGKKTITIDPRILLPGGAIVAGAAQAKETVEAIPGDWSAKLELLGSTFITVIVALVLLTLGFVILLRKPIADAAAPVVKAGVKAVL